MAISLVGHTAALRVLGEPSTLSAQKSVEVRNAKSMEGCGLQETPVSKRGGKWRGSWPAGDRACDTDAPAHCGNLLRPEGVSREKGRYRQKRMQVGKAQEKKKNRPTLDATTWSRLNDAVKTVRKARCPGHNQWAGYFFPVHARRDAVQDRPESVSVSE